MENSNPPGATRAKGAPSPKTETSPTERTQLGRRPDKDVPGIRDAETFSDAASYRPPSDPSGTGSAERQAPTVRAPGRNNLRSA